MAVTVYGDNPLTQEKEGFMEGEPMFIRIHNPDNLNSKQVLGVYSEKCVKFKMN